MSRLLLETELLHCQRLPLGPQRLELLGHAPDVLLRMDQSDLMRMRIDADGLEPGVLGGDAMRRARRAASDDDLETRLQLTDPVVELIDLAPLRERPHARPPPGPRP